MQPVRVAFICVYNSCLSQIAEGFTHNLGGELFEAYSAGTLPNRDIEPVAIALMLEVGIDISNQETRFINELPAPVDVLITLGENVDCPFIPTKHREVWNVNVPEDFNIDNMRQVRDSIRKKVMGLIARARNGEFAF